MAEESIDLIRLEGGGGNSVILRIAGKEAEGLVGCKKKSTSQVRERIGS
ncbi:hypothetical protein ACH40F_20550 [Streptomyces sp. NPDC020794]